MSHPRRICQPGGPGSAPASSTRRSTRRSPRTATETTWSQWTTPSVACSAVRWLSGVWSRLGHAVAGHQVPDPSTGSPRSNRWSDVTDHASGDKPVLRISQEVGVASAGARSGEPLGVACRVPGDPSCRPPRWTTTRRAPSEAGAGDRAGHLGGGHPRCGPRLSAQPRAGRDLKNRLLGDRDDVALRLALDAPRPGSASARTMSTLGLDAQQHGRRIDRGLGQRAVGHGPRSVEHHGIWGTTSIVTQPASRRAGDVGVASEPPSRVLNPCVRLPTEQLA